MDYFDGKRVLSESKCPWNFSGKMRKIPIKVLTYGGIVFYWDIDDEIIGKNSLTDALVKGLKKPSQRNLEKIRSLMSLYLALPNEIFYLRNRRPLGLYTSPSDYKEVVEKALGIMDKDISIQMRIQEVIPLFWD